MKRLVSALSKTENGGDSSKHTDQRVKPVGSHHDGDFHTYLAHKVAKLRTLHQAESIISNVFDGCVIAINGVTNPPIEELRQIISLHGGQFAAYRFTKLTHIVCDYLTDAQLKSELSKIKSNCTPKYVTALWVTESVRMMKRQAESLYYPKGLADRYGENIAGLFNSLTTENNVKKNQRHLYSSSSSSHSHLNFVEEKQTVAVETRLESIESMSDIVRVELETLMIIRESENSYAKIGSYMSEKISECFMKKNYDGLNDFGGFNLIT